MTRALALTALLFLAACATPQTAYLQGSSAEIAAETEKQKELALREEMKNHSRLRRVAQPILTRNAAICGEKVAPYYGFMTGTIDQIGRSYQAAAHRVMGLDENVRVVSVVPGSPAAAAGLSGGERIVSINETKIGTGAGAMRQAIKAVENDTDGTLAMTVVKGGKERKIAIKGAAACDFGVALSDDSNINAYADGNNIFITRGMMRFVNNDNELALVVGHELAHNAALHIDKKKQNVLAAGLLGAVLDVAVGTGGDFTRAAMDIGAGAHSVGFEQEADYIGLYMMSRAGYSTDGAADFWRRMAAENNSASISHRSSHPTSPERFVAIEKTRKEIAAKRAAGKALMPNMAPQDPPAQTVRKNYN